jgi:hypothetical protein
MPKTWHPQIRMANLISKPGNAAGLVYAEDKESFLVLEFLVEGLDSQSETSKSNDQT